MHAVRVTVFVLRLAHHGQVCTGAASLIMTPGCQGTLPFQLHWLCLHHLKGVAKSRRQCPCRELTQSREGIQIAGLKSKSCFPTSCQAPPCSQQDIFCLAAAGSHISDKQSVDCQAGAFFGECSLGVYQETLWLTCADAPLNKTASFAQERSLECQVCLVQPHCQ